MERLCPILGFDYLEFYVGNAKQAAQYYSKLFGFTITAYRGLESGYRKTASYLLEQGQIRLMLTSALSEDHPIAHSVLTHGDGVGVLAFRVANARQTYLETTARGAMGAIPPTEVETSDGVFRFAAIQAYGDILIKFIDHQQYTGKFEPGFQAYQQQTSIPLGLEVIDHVVANVEMGKMDQWSRFFETILGFELMMKFDQDAISTEYSALMSNVMQDPTGTIKLPINEPAVGKRISQIQEYLDFNHGPGIQHIAFRTHDIIRTVTHLQKAGVEFLEIPAAYYADLEARVGPIAEPVSQLAKLGILVDRDRDGYLLQIFTKPLQDRPTLFFEIIERHGSQGFGEGNFKSLFEAIEREQAKRGNL